MRTARWGCRPGGNQRRAPRNRAVAIHAIELNGSTRLAVQFSSPMTILLEVAVQALHSFFQVDIRKVDGFVEFLRIIGGDRASLFIEQVSLAVARIDGAKQPAVTVEIG